MTPAEIAAYHQGRADLYLAIARRLGWRVRAGARHHPIGDPSRDNPPANTTEETP